MQTPERLALIGGSILLSSTLVFTLKSQASSIVPRIHDASTKIFDHIGDAQQSSDFAGDLKDAQKKGWRTGNWGSSKYYIDDQDHMYIGQGQLAQGLNTLLGDDVARSIRSISFTQSVQAPADSSYLLSTDKDTDYTNSRLTRIDHLDHLDTSQVTNMDGMFYSNTSLSSLDVSTFDTSNVRTMKDEFTNDISLHDLDLSNWRTSSVNDMTTMFSNDLNLDRLSLDNFDNLHADTGHMFGGPWSQPDDKLTSLTLGDRTQLGDAYLPPHDWQNGNHTGNSDRLTDEHVHPGTWTRN